MSTRLYFDSTNTPPVSPAYAADWDATNEAVRRKLLAAKTTDITNGGNIIVTDGVILGMQFVSDPLSAQTISGTVKCQMLVRDPDGSVQVTSRLLIKVVSNDGSSVRGTLLEIGDYSAGTFFNTFPTRNKTFADGDALSSVDASAGDRLVIELGCNNPNGDEVRFSFGASIPLSDLPENETTTTNLAPWIELSGDISFQSGSVSGAPNLLLLGVG